MLKWTPETISKFRKRKEKCRSGGKWKNRVKQTVHFRLKMILVVEGKPDKEI